MKYQKILSQSIVNSSKLLKLPFFLGIAVSSLLVLPKISLAQSESSQVREKAANVPPEKTGAAVPEKPATAPEKPVIAPKKADTQGKDDASLDDEKTNAEETIPKLEKTRADKLSSEKPPEEEKAEDLSKKSDGPQAKPEDKVLSPEDFKGGPNKRKKKKIAVKKPKLFMPKLYNAEFLLGYEMAFYSLTGFRYDSSQTSIENHQGLNFQSQVCPMGWLGKTPVYQMFCLLGGFSQTTAPKVTIADASSGENIASYSPKIQNWNMGIMLRMGFSNNKYIPHIKILPSQRFNYLPQLKGPISEAAVLPVNIKGIGIGMGLEIPISPNITTEVNVDSLVAITGQVQHAPIDVLSNSNATIRSGTAYYIWARSKIMWTGVEIFADIGYTSLSIKANNEDVATRTLNLKGVPIKMGMGYSL